MPVCETVEQLDETMAEIRQHPRPDGRRKITVVPALEAIAKDRIRQADTRVVLRVKEPVNPGAYGRARERKEHGKRGQFEVVPIAGASVSTNGHKAAAIVAELRGTAPDGTVTVMAYLTEASMGPARHFCDAVASDLPLGEFLANYMSYRKSDEIF